MMKTNYVRNEVFRELCEFRIKREFPERKISKQVVHEFIMNVGVFRMEKTKPTGRLMPDASQSLSIQ